VFYKRENEMKQKRENTKTARRRKAMYPKTYKVTPVAIKDGCVKGGD
jgi:hypothetical protein